MELMDIYESYEDVNPVMEPKIRLNKAAQKDFFDYIERDLYHGLTDLARCYYKYEDLEVRDRKVKDYLIDLFKEGFVPNMGVDVFLEDIPPYVSTRYFGKYMDYTTASNDNIDWFIEDYVLDDKFMEALAELLEYYDPNAPEEEI